MISFSVEVVRDPTPCAERRQHYTLYLIPYTFLIPQQIALILSLHLAPFFYAMPFALCPMPYPARRLFLLDNIVLFDVNSLNTLELPPMPVRPTLKFVPGQIFASVEKISQISCPQKR